MTTPRAKSPFLLLFAILIGIVAIFLAYTWLALTWSYSNGERAGFMQKFSQKGFLCKTWEGELSLIAIPGAAPEKFFFSVRDPLVAKQIEAAMGKRVSLVYEQHVGVPSSCFGETQYFVVGVREVITNNSGRDLTP